MRYKIGFLGVGVMGGGLLKHILSKITPSILEPNDICIFDINSQMADQFKRSGVTIAEDINYLLENTEFLILGIKPQVFSKIFTKTAISHPNCVVSIMAGTKIAHIKHIFPNSTSIIRLMPNLPCLIGEGAIGFVDTYATKSDTIFIQSIFSLCGKIYPLIEEELDLFTCISGSGPAYLFYFAQSLSKAVEDLGFSKEKSISITLNTILGSAKYALESNIDLDDLVSAVCSKGGTTIEAINVFKEEKLNETLKKGVLACKNKANKLSD